MNDRTKLLLMELPSPVFILGAAYSGKSELSITALPTSGFTTVIGTAGISDLEPRISELKALRPDHWQHREGNALNDLLDAALPASEQILIDSINQWMANFLLEGWSKYNLKQQDARIDFEVRKLIASMNLNVAKRFVIVSSEVGAGVTPPQELSRFFRQALGRTHIALAQASRSVVQVIAGIPTVIKKIDVSV